MDLGLNTELCEREHKTILVNIKIFFYPRIKMFILRVRESTCLKIAISVVHYTRTPVTNNFHFHLISLVYSLMACILNRRVWGIGDAQLSYHLRHSVMKINPSSISNGHLIGSTSRTEQKRTERYREPEGHVELNLIGERSCHLQGIQPGTTKHTDPE